ncbi:hypothetical protein [Leucobacter sp. USHLN153]|uniref:hypothetical protein n=1 Tax=Leucobacter sp. USHLN153 TaxID=3081268 RepID=UPI00301AD40A
MVDVYVVGDGIVELSAALEFAELGLTVRIVRPLADRDARVEISRALGGRKGIGERNAPGKSAARERGFDPDRVTDPDGALHALVEHVSAPLDPRSPVASAPLTLERFVPRPARVRTRSGGLTSQPWPAVFGIPAVPLSEASQRVLGGAGATRAFLDRVLPLLTIGKTRTLGALVRGRLGRKVAERLLLPLVWEKYGVDPDRVDVAVAAPGLNEDVTTAASLCGAVLPYAERYVARETIVRPAGGWSELQRALLERLSLFSVEVIEAEVAAIAPGSVPAEQAVNVEPGEHESDAVWTVTERAEAGETETIEARAIVLGEGHDPAEALREGSTPRAVDQQRWIVSATVAPPPEVCDDETLDALTVERSVDGSLWVVRWIAPQGGSAGSVPDAWSVHCSGPAHEGHLGSAADAAESILAALELTERPAGVAARAVPALYSSREARELAAAHTTSLRETERTCLRVGASRHSGDLASAVTDAREVSARLRKRLTGIAE